MPVEQRRRADKHATRRQGRRVDGKGREHIAVGRQQGGVVFIFRRLGNAQNAAFKGNVEINFSGRGLIPGYPKTCAVIGFGNFAEGLATVQ